MNRRDIRERVGEHRYETACALARDDSARPDYGGRTVGPPRELPHEIQELIWDAPVPWAERIALLFAVYDDMPAYGHLLYAKLHYSDFGPQERTRWWSEVRARLAGTDKALRQPLQYALWCGFFEDEASVAEAWAALTAGDAEPEVVRAVLPMAGPVPYALKAAVYRRLLPDEAWHGAICESLLRSATDVYGDLDREDARRIFLQLRLPAELPHVEDLRARLA